MPTEYELGLLIGLLIGEGHFGGDGRQPQITLRMHVRHEALFRWLERTFPGGRLYGPYDHGGRRYFQWMARGVYLRDELLPLIGSRISPDLDAYAYERVMQMMTRYRPQLAPRSSPGTVQAHGDLSTPEPVPGPLDPAVETSDTGTSGDQDAASRDLGDRDPGDRDWAAEEPSILSRAESIFSRMRDPEPT
jgi:hypothetical protein